MRFIAAAAFAAALMSVASSQVALAQPQPGEPQPKPDAPAKPTPRPDAPANPGADAPVNPAAKPDAPAASVAGPESPTPAAPGAGAPDTSVAAPTPPDAAPVTGTTGTAAHAPRLATVAAPRKSAPEFNERLVLETGRVVPGPSDPTGVVFTIHGEYQLRYRGMSDLRLQAPVSAPELTLLGQNQYLYQWFRLSPRLSYRDKIILAGQIDVPRGLVVGDTTVRVEKVRDAYAVEKWYEVHPRALYLEYRSPIGIFRAGHQTSHWGMGILANDGDHPEMFGDYLRGSITERFMFATTPLGKNTPLSIAIAGDLVFEDNTADLLGNDLEYDLDGDGEEEEDEQDGDRAYQGVAAVLWHEKAFDLGIYGVIRHQERDRLAVDSLTPFLEELTVGVIDITGKFNTRVPGAEAYAYGQIEAAMIFGSTSFVRSSYSQPVNPREEREDEKVMSFGAAAKLGVVHVSGEGKRRWGKVVTEVEWGYATGDANPIDGTSKRFTFDPNHNVGLVLFDHVLAWKTARAATIAQDEAVVNRAAPGLQLLPSKGGVFGATYVNPRFIVRPAPWLDLKGGVLIAQTTADLVDPYHFGGLGDAANYDGGDETSHDLGLELDLGIEGRIAIDNATVIQIGAEGGVLFPGNAFDDAAGEGLDNQYVGNAKVGLQF